MRKISGVAEGILAPQRTLPHAVGWLVGWLVCQFLDSFKCPAKNVPPIHFCRDNQ